MYNFWIMLFYGTASADQTTGACCLIIATWAKLGTKWSKEPGLSASTWTQEVSDWDVRSAADCMHRLTIGGLFICNSSLASSSAFYLAKFLVNSMSDSAYQTMGCTNFNTLVHCSEGPCCLWWTNHPSSPPGLFVSSPPSHFSNKCSHVGSLFSVYAPGFV